MKKFLLFSVVILFSACSSRPPEIAKPVETTQHQNQLTSLEQWQFKGRLAYKDQQQKQSANVHWQQKGEQFSMSLNTFIGTQVLALTQTPKLATLEIDDERHSAPNAEILLESLTQWRLPVNKLNQWFKGASTQEDKVTYAEQGWISQIQHQQWLIQYARYQITEGVVLPHEITVRNQDVSIKLRINEWILN